MYHISLKSQLNNDKIEQVSKTQNAIFVIMHTHDARISLSLLEISSIAAPIATAQKLNRNTTKENIPPISTASHILMLIYMMIMAASQGKTDRE